MLGPSDDQIHHFIVLADIHLAQNNNTHSNDSLAYKTFVNFTIYQ